MNDDLPDLPIGTSFFQALRQLEDGKAVYGRTRDRADEPARLAQALRTGFAKGDIDNLRPARGKRPAVLTVNAFGLFGPEGPMPLHLSWWMQRRQSDRWYDEETGDIVADTGFLDFCNMLQHRMIGLFYRAWADTRAEVDADRGGTGVVGSMGRAISGLGLPEGRTGDPHIDAMCLTQATSMAQEQTWPGKLASGLQHLFGVPVTVREFVGNWMDLPPRLQSRLAHPVGGRLGVDTVAGARIYMRQNRIEVTLGPMKLSEYRQFLPGSVRFDRLRRALSRLIGGGPDADVRLVLAGEDVPPARLGQVGLGRDAWLGRIDAAPADDLCLRAVRTTFREAGP
ncbi:MAG: type VI secretion system baseplate subunit TssG [Paracoccaceae bacterium]|nr:type VI secretion system baseplate subunit TssG [Paracoccaceae bacterium]